EEVATENLSPKISRRSDGKNLRAVWWRCGGPWGLRKKDGERLRRPSRIRRSNWLLGAGRCDPRASVVRSQHHHKRARLHPAVEIDHILIGQPDATRRNRMSDPSGLVRAVDALERVLAAGVEVERARTHWIACTGFDIVRKRAEPALLTLGRRPSRPLFLAADRGHAGPRLSILAHDRAVADRLTVGQHVINVALGGIDQDSAWRFLTVIPNDLTPIGGRNPRLPVRRDRPVPPVDRREIEAGGGTGRKRHAGGHSRENVLGGGRSHRGEKRRDRDAGHEDVSDAAAQAGLATDQQSERPPTRAPMIPRRTVSQCLRRRAEV